MAKNIRQQRLESEMKKILSETLSREKIHDLDVANFMPFISAVELSRDYSVAKVYLYLNNCPKEQEEEVLKAFQEHVYAFKKELAKNLRLRKVPHISFVLDNSFDYADKINNLLKNINEK